MALKKELFDPEMVELPLSELKYTTILSCLETSGLLHPIVNTLFSTDQPILTPYDPLSFGNTNDLQLITQGSIISEQYFPSFEEVPDLDDIPPLEASYQGKNDSHTLEMPGRNTANSMGDIKSQEILDEEILFQACADVNAAPSCEGETPGLIPEAPSHFVPVQNCQKIVANTLEGADTVALRRYRNMQAARRSRARRRTGAISELSAVNEKIFRENMELKEENARLRRLLARFSKELPCSELS